jgi:hypothetical protein
MSTEYKPVQIKGMPAAGPRRYWQVLHQPQKKTTPLRLELRQRTNQNSDNVVASFSRLIAFDDVIAKDDAIIEGAVRVLERAANVDNYVTIVDGSKVFGIIEGKN